VGRFVGRKAKRIYEHFFAFECGDGHISLNGFGAKRETVANRLAFSKRTRLSLKIHRKTCLTSNLTAVSACESLRHFFDTLGGGILSSDLSQAYDSQVALLSRPISEVQI
jgi:hypothetical protein